VKKLNGIFLTGIFALIIYFSLVFALFPGKISAQQNDNNYQEFYDQLNPYGQWIENSNYGYVWIPTAGPDFTPYLTNGYWVYSDEGWTWVSDYNWGWAPFHYGRWDYNGSYGWFWVPDNEWGPSWVTWRRSEGYYGWAPMRPGVTINVTFGRNNDVPNDRWIFVRDRDIENHDIGRNHISRKNNMKIMNSSTIITQTYYDDKRRTTYVAGPARQDVQKITGRTIKSVVIHEKDKPGQSITGDQIQIYRPVIQKNSSGNKPVPPTLTNLKDVKQISERAASKPPQNKETLNSSKAIGAQKIARNPLDKTNKKVNAPLQLNPVQPGNNSRTMTQSASSPANKVNAKNTASQTRTVQATNPPRKNRSTDQTPKVQAMNPPKIHVSTDRPPKVQPMNSPKIHNSTDRPPRNQKINPPKVGIVKQQPRPNQNNVKNEERRQN
jgi:hypothetical protein